MKVQRSAIYNPKVWVQILLIFTMIGVPQIAVADAGAVATIQVYRAVNFQINYRTADSPGACGPDDGDFQAWGAEAQVAMNHVVDILDDLLNSSTPIVIDACFQLVDPAGDTLAFAGENGSLTQDEVPALPIANRTYPVALANAISGFDQNGGEVEIVATANSAVAWDFCTVGCTVAGDRTDFVSTMVHEVLHGLGFSTSFDQDQDNPSLGVYAEPPAVIDDFVIRAADGVKLLDLPNGSAALLNAMQQGSGAVAFSGPNTLAANNGVAPFLYTPNLFSQGSSMSHWDDDHPTNLGRMMNSATGDGPSSRVVDAVTLMVLKDIGWSVNEPSDYGDSALAAYGNARHINDPSFVHYIILGASFSATAGPVMGDPSTDGVKRPQTWTVGANGGQFTVTVSSNQVAARGCLSGWIDWNADGNFAGPGEQIVAMSPVSAGEHPVQFDIPAHAGSGVLYNARIRLMPDWNGDGFCNDQAPLTPSGSIFGGEAEDYQWPLSGGTVVVPPAEQRLILTLISRQN